MIFLGTRTIVRSGALVLAALALAAATVAVVWPSLHPVLVPGRSGPRSFEELLTALAALAVLAGALWLVLVATAAAIESITRGRAHVVRFTGCPQAWRRWLLGICGAAILAGTAAPSYADSRHQHEHERGTVAGFDRLPMPDRPVGGLAQSGSRHAAHHVSRPYVRPVRASLRPASGTLSGATVVRPGDSLWRIAQRQLPADASDSQVDELWHRIHVVNRAVIGPDPDVIQPGLRLQLPNLTTHQEETP